jgi:catechol 2,3-dioxygenase-like lactoylglutathione lyase family enzyme
MAFHHVAFATKDVKANHEFYTGPMGFRLVKVEVGRAGERGFAKHLFYDTGGGQMIAFWDFHDPDLSDDWSSAISTGQGLPVWANHIAFDAPSLDDLAARRERWLEHGVDVMEVDHGWCTSIYAEDPNGILVEFCTSTRALTEADREEALRRLEDPRPALASDPAVRIHRAGGRPR